MQANSNDTRVMDDSIARLQAKVAKQIEAREASLKPLRAYALRHAAESSDASERELALIALEQELAA
jgi:hypothetical protein